MTSPETVATETQGTNEPPADAPNDLSESAKGQRSEEDQPEAVKESCEEVEVKDRDEQKPKKEAVQVEIIGYCCEPVDIIDYGLIDRLRWRTCRWWRESLC